MVQCIDPLQDRRLHVQKPLLGLLRLGKVPEPVLMASP